MRAPLPGQPSIQIQHAFFYDGQMHNLGELPGDVASEGTAINDHNCAQVAMDESQIPLYSGDSSGLSPLF